MQMQAWTKVAKQWQRRLGLLLLLAATACGNDGSTDAGGSEIPPIPTAGDPAFGRVGHALVSDQGFSFDLSLDRMWIGFNRQDRWEAFLELQARRPDGTSWIGGPLRADASQPLGFYFDPDGTLGGEIAADGIQSNLDRLKADPAAAERTPFGAWAIPTVVEQIVPAG